jgi:phosphatidylinositol alpha-mannosyltransferase
MRLAIVSPYAWTVPSGVNHHVTSLVSQLEHRGHEVWIVAPAGTLTRSAGTLPDNFILAGRSLPVRSNGSVAHANAWPLMMQRMGRILVSQRFDLVHVHEPTIPSVGCSATMAAKVPVVGTFHAAGGASHYYERWRPLAARILASLTVRVAVSESARDCVIGHFPGDYRVIPNGIDLETYAKAREGRKVRGRILFIGRPEPRKGLQVLVKAFKGLRSRVPGASLVLVGPTFEEFHALMARSRTASAEDFRGITPLGRVPLEAKLEQMREAEVLCAPSLGGESFGIVLTEALAAGLPVVASDIPGYRAVLAEGAVGMLVPPGSASALENALFSLLRDAELRRELSLAGSARAERYSWDRVVDQVLEVYEEAICLGPRVVKEPAVPVLGLMRHFIVSKASGGKKPEEAGSQALS